MLEWEGESWTINKSAAGNRFLLTMTRNVWEDNNGSGATWALINLMSEAGGICD